jgi:diguanylate cyclase (GGDEF)-like protein
MENPELGELESFKQTIGRLEQSLDRSWTSVAAETALILGTGAVSLFCAEQFLSTQLSATVVVEGFATLLLACNAHRAYQFKQLKKVHTDLNKQLSKAIAQRRKVDKLYNLSILDPLTGLHNRRFGEERLREEIERAAKNSDPLAVLVFDLDYFKQINDQYGHAAGDAALRSFSHSLKKAIRACDAAVRIGGDEFLVVLPDCPREKVDVILKRLGTPQVELDGEMKPVRYSVGRAHYQVSDTIESLQKRADEALYTQKQGRSKATSTPAPAVVLPLGDENKGAAKLGCSLADFTPPMSAIELSNESFVM